MKSGLNINFEAVTILSAVLISCSAGHQNTDPGLAVIENGRSASLFGKDPS